MIENAMELFRQRLSFLNPGVIEFDFINPTKDPQEEEELLYQELLIRLKHLLKKNPNIKINFFRDDLDFIGSIDYIDGDLETFMEFQFLNVAEFKPNKIIEHVCEMINSMLHCIQLFKDGKIKGKHLHFQPVVLESNDPIPYLIKTKKIWEPKTK